MLTSLNYVCDMSVTVPLSSLLAAPECPGYCSLCLSPDISRPPPQPASPLLAASGHSLAHNSHNILPVSYLHHHKMPGLDVNILKDCAPYWYYIQSHYSGLLSITRWETGWNMESDIQDHNSGDVVIIPDELSSCDRSLSDNSLQISLHYVWLASRRLWGTIAHLPRWSRSLLNKTFHKIVLVRFYDAYKRFLRLFFKNYKLCLRLSFVLQKWSLLLTSDLIKNHFLDYHFIELHFEETQLGFRTQYITIHSKQLNDAFLQLKVVLFIMISHFHMKTFVYFQQATTLLFCIASTPLVFVASNV